MAAADLIQASLLTDPSGAMELALAYSLPSAVTSLVPEFTDPRPPVPGAGAAAAGGAGDSAEASAPPTSGADAPASESASEPASGGSQRTLQDVQDTEDLYQTLGLERGASVSEVRRQYKKLAMQYHPDKNPGAEAQARFQNIVRAHDILKDEEAKERYDTYGVTDPKVKIVFKEVPADAGGSSGPKPKPKPVPKPRPRAGPKAPPPALDAPAPPACDGPPSGTDPTSPTSAGGAEAVGGRQGVGGRRGLAPARLQRSGGQAH